MRITRSFRFFIFLLILFFSWQLAGQFELFAAAFGLPITPKLTASDQYIIS